MALGVMIIIVLIGVAAALADDELGAFFACLFIAGFISLMTAGLAELVDGVDRTEYSTVERIECLHTTDGLVVLAGDRLFEEHEYVYRPDVQQIVAEYEDQDDALSWPWEFVHTTRRRLEFAGCPE